MQKYARYHMKGYIDSVQLYWAFPSFNAMKNRSTVMICFPQVFGIGRLSSYSR